MAKARTAVQTTNLFALVGNSNNPERFRSLKLETAVRKQTPTSRSCAHC